MLHVNAVWVHVTCYYPDTIFTIVVWNLAVTYPLGSFNTKRQTGGRGTGYRRESGEKMERLTKGRKHSHPLFPALIVQQISLHLSYSTSKMTPSLIQFTCEVILHLPQPLVQKYDPRPCSAPTASQLKSTGHVCFFRNDKCCTLAVLLPTSHLS